MSSNPLQLVAEIHNERISKLEEEHNDISADVASQKATVNYMSAQIDDIKSEVSQTRQDLKESMRDLKDSFRDTMGDVKQDLKDLSYTLKATSTSLASHTDRLAKLEAVQFDAERRKERRWGLLKDIVLKWITPGVGLGAIAKLVYFLLHLS